MPNSSISPSTILFLCTGNYYRSRYTEIAFNFRANMERLPWRAESAGLAVERGVTNIGPIGRNALSALEMRRIVDDAATRRYPRPVVAADFEEASLVICLKEEEHRPLMQERFPLWVNAVEYWNVHDRPPSKSYDPMTDIDISLDALLCRPLFWSVTHG